MPTNPQRAREDFDTLARLAPTHWTITDHYLPRLLALLPDAANDALEIGCGTGRFARALAARFASVTAIDISPASLELARARSTEHPNIDYVCADVESWAWPESSFDCVVCLAALHHMRLEPTISRMKRALRPGGTLIIHDVFHHSRRTPPGLATLALGVPSLLVLHRLRQPPVVDRAALRRFWRQHASHETFLTTRDLRRVRTTLLPGARIRTHVISRYTLTWRRPPARPEHRAPHPRKEQHHAQAHSHDRG